MSPIQKGSCVCSFVNSVICSFFLWVCCIHPIDYLSQLKCSQKLNIWLNKWGMMERQKRKLKNEHDREEVLIIMPNSSLCYFTSSQWGSGFIGTKKYKVLFSKTLFFSLLKWKERKENQWTWRLDICFLAVLSECNVLGKLPKIHTLLFYLCMADVVCFWKC